MHCLKRLKRMTPKRLVKKCGVKWKGVCVTMSRLAEGRLFLPHFYRDLLAFAVPHHDELDRVIRNGAQNSRFQLSRSAYRNSGKLNHNVSLFDSRHIGGKAG